MLVEDVMTAALVTCRHEESLQTAVVRLLDENVGSVIVIKNGDPMGIVTESDALIAGASSKQPFHDIPVAEVLSHPLVTIQPEKPIRKAVERMEANDIKKLAVVEDLDLLGIVTITDIAMSHAEILKEARTLAEQRERWEARKTDIDEF